MMDLTTAERRSAHGAATFPAGCRAGESEIAFSKRRARRWMNDPPSRRGYDCSFYRRTCHGGGRCHSSPEGYWAEIQEVLTRHDILLIADEIICGFGAPVSGLRHRPMTLLPTC